MTSVGNKVQFDHCPITLEKLGEDTMIIMDCTHRISEMGLKQIYASKKIPYDVHTIKKDLSLLEITCPCCREEINDIKPDHVFRNLFGIAKEAKIIPMNSLEDFSSEVKAIQNPIFDVQNNNAANVSNPPGEYHIPIDEMHYEKTLDVVAPPPFSPRAREYRPRANTHMDNYSFNEKHYRSHLLSYGYITELTEREIDACHLRDVKECVKLGLLSRIVKTLSCCLLTPVITAHSMLTCAASTCAVFVAPVGIAEILDEDSDYDCEEDLEFMKCLCTSGCTGYGYTAILCAECWTNVMCCPAEVCVPECTNRAGLPWLYRVYEKSKSVLWKWCRDVND